MKPKPGQHISETQPEQVQDELKRNLLGQADHSLLGRLRRDSRVGAQYRLLGRILLEDTSRDLPVKPGSAPNDPRALRGIPAIGGFGSMGGAIAGSRPGDSLRGRRGEDVLREIRWRARERERAADPGRGDLDPEGEGSRGADPDHE